MLCKLRQSQLDAVIRDPFQTRQARTSQVFACRLLVKERYHY